MSREPGWWVVWTLREDCHGSCRDEAVAVFARRPDAERFRELSPRPVLVEAFEMSWGIACPLCGNEWESRGD